jgi:hypothetical protein
MRSIRIALLFAGVASAGIAALSAFGSTSTHNRQNAVFHAISARNVSDVHTKINGSANARNQIPAGTVLTYRTNAGNLGKMQINRYGYNLRVRWVTYRPNGTVLSRGKNLLIRGTYNYDLDLGVQAGQNDPTTDLWWEQVTQKRRYLHAMNGASFTIASYYPCELPRAVVGGVDPCHKQ